MNDVEIEEEMCDRCGDWFPPQELQTGHLGTDWEDVSICSDCYAETGP